jgi:ATP-dependent Clp protease ATP-binding subunit ClpB
LIDEASATVRVTRDSQPEEIDRLERQKLQLEIELTALRREIERNKTTKDESSKMRIEEVQFAISKLQEELDPIAAKYQAEKAQADEIQSAKKVGNILSASSSFLTR